MKLIALLFLSFVFQSGKANISMDDETLLEGEMPTLIYVLGCGNWNNFTFSVINDQINASADVPSNWFNCHIDPAPPQFWNRLPLTQLPVGDYQLNITLNGLTQSETSQLTFTIRGGTQVQSVPVNRSKALVLLVVLIVLSGLYQRKTYNLYNN